MFVHCREDRYSCSLRHSIIPTSTCASVRQQATSGYSVVGAVCELDPVHHSRRSDGVQCITGVITHVQPCMKLSKVSSFPRRFHHPCRGSWQFRCDPSCWSSSVVRPRAARHRSNSQVRRHIRPYNHRIGRDHRISRSWSTWHQLRPRFGVLLYTHTVICSQAIRSSSKFAWCWRGVDRPTLFEAIRNSPIGGPSTSSDHPKHYRLVSNLTFVLKVTERIVSEQLVEYTVATYRLTIWCLECNQYIGIIIRQKPHFFELPQTSSVLQTKERSHYWVSLT